MSKGSPIRTMRFPEELVQRIEAAIASANDRKARTRYDWTSWVRKAINEKLSHLVRGKRPRKRRRRATPGAGQVGEVLPPGVEALTWQG